MSLYAIKNDEGKWLGCEVYCEEPDWFDRGGFMWDTRSVAEENVNLYGGHVVELAEAPAKVVVNQEEEYLLKELQNGGYLASDEISYFSENHTDDELDQIALQDRLMRAYVIGWKVEKPKRYLIKVPHTDDSYFYKIDDEYCNAGDSYHLEGMTDNKWFTAAEIEHYGLHDFEKLEVTDVGE